MGLVNQYTQGSLITFTVNSLDGNGNPVVPDATPTYTLYNQNPPTPIIITQNALMVPITSVSFYANIDSTVLPVGSYLAVTSWFISGLQYTANVNFDVLLFDGSTILPWDPISRLRLRLRDNDPNPTRWVWSDQELSEYLQDALDDHNAAPPIGSWFWFNVPLVYMPNIMLGATITALQANAIKVAHSPITYSDRGVAVNRMAQSANYLNISGNLRDKYEQERLRIKRQYAYNWGYIVSPNMPYISAPPIRSCDRAWSF